METFFQAIAGAMIALILCLTLDKQDKQMSLMLTVAVCCMIGGLAAAFLKPVLEFLEHLQTLANLDGEMLRTLLKAVGIGLIAQVAGLVCNDAGNAALGKTLQMLAAAVILWLSVPLLQQLLDLLEQILGEV